MGVCECYNMKGMARELLRGVGYLLIWDGKMNSGLLSGITYVSHTHRTISQDHD